MTEHAENTQPRRLGNSEKSKPFLCVFESLRLIVSEDSGRSAFSS